MPADVDTSHSPLNSSSSPVVVYIRTPWGTVCRSPALSQSLNTRHQREQVSASLPAALQRFIELETGACSDTYRLQYGSRPVICNAEGPVHGSDGHSVTFDTSPSTKGQPLSPMDCCSLPSGSLVKMIPRRRWVDVYGAVASDTAERILTTCFTDDDDDSDSDDETEVRNYSRQKNADKNGADFETASSIGRRDAKSTPAIGQSNDDVSGGGGDATVDDVTSSEMLRHCEDHTRRVFVAVCLLCRSERLDSADVIDFLLTRVDRTAVLTTRTPCGLTADQLVTHNIKPSSLVRSAPSRDVTSDTRIQAAQCVLRHLRDVTCAAAEAERVSAGGIGRALTTTSDSTVQTAASRDAPTAVSDWSTSNGKRGQTRILPWSMMTQRNGALSGRSCSNISSRNTAAVLPPMYGCSSGSGCGWTTVDELLSRPSTAATLYARDSTSSLARRRELARELSGVNSGQRTQSATCYYRSKYHDAMDRAKVTDVLPVPRPATAGARYRAWKTWLADKYEREDLEKQDAQHSDKIKRTEMADEAFRKWLREKARIRRLHDENSSDAANVEFAGRCGEVLRMTSAEASALMRQWLKERMTRDVIAADSRPHSRSCGNDGHNRLRAANGDACTAAEAVGASKQASDGEDRSPASLPKTLLFDHKLVRSSLNQPRRQTSGRSASSHGSALNASSDDATVTSSRKTTSRLCQHQPPDEHQLQQQQEQRGRGKNNNRVGVFQIGYHSTAADDDVYTSDDFPASSDTINNNNNNNNSYSRCSLLRFGTLQSPRYGKTTCSGRVGVRRTALDDVRRELILEGMTFEEWLGLKQSEQAASRAQ